MMNLLEQLKWSPMNIPCSPIGNACGPIHGHENKLIICEIKEITSNKSFKNGTMLN